MNNPIINIQLNDDDFLYLSAIIYRECGIKINEGKKALVQARLMRRMRELRIREYHEYLRFLADNYKDEKINLINCITTNKTEFFRESYHFEFMKSTVLPAYAETRKQRLRIWSAGCSTGQEPYTIAMTLFEHFGGAMPPDARILATDIDTNVIQTGRDGVYREDLFKGIDPGIMKRYFLRGRGENQGLYRVKEYVKKLVCFRRLNLLDEYYPMKGPFDIIFCRNVMIYFDKDTQRRLLAKFNRYLADDGYLFMGHSESLNGISNDFKTVGRSVYRKIQ